MYLQMDLKKKVDSDTVSTALALNSSHMKRWMPRGTGNTKCFVSEARHQL